MRNNILIWAALLFIGASLSHICDRGFSVHAQSIGVSPSSATTLAGCPAPAANFMNFCQVTNDPNNPAGAYVTANGVAYFLLQKAATGGNAVATVFGRTGNVVGAQGDYSYSQLSGQPTTLSCSTSSQSNSGFTASGCTIK